MGAPFFICICSCAGSRKGKATYALRAGVDSIRKTSRSFPNAGTVPAMCFVKGKPTSRWSPYMATGDTLVARVQDLPARSEAAAVTLTASISPPTRVSHSDAVRESVCLDVLNTATHAIRVRSAAHFFEVNRALKFDRAAAFGMKLDQESGTSVRFQPGEIVRVALIRGDGGIGLHTAGFGRAGEVRRRGLRRR